jgi:nitroreductase
MNVLEAISARCSVRAYLPKPVEPDKLESIVAAATQAPSAGNCQSYIIHVVHNEERRRALAKAAMPQDFVAQAPVVLVFCACPAQAARYGPRGEQLFCIQDASIAAAYAQLAATTLGLGTCWVGAFGDEMVAGALHLPDDQRPVVLLSLGYAADTPPRAPRRPLGELVQTHL